MRQSIGFGVQYSLFQTLKDIEGNQKVCTLTEPLWGIPYQLYVPFVSLYMAALGVSDAQIGIVLSIGMVIQVIAAILSGAITDKFGRRWTTMVVDLIAWSIPCLIWIFAQNHIWFYIAAVFNGLWRITAVSWTCLLVEDADEDRLVKVFAWIHIFGILAGFVSPLAGVLVKQWGIIPAVRSMYAFAFVSMTTKFVLLFFYSKEPTRGKKRMQESKDQSLWGLVSGLKGILKSMIKSKKTMTTLGIVAVLTTVLMINGSYWPLLVTGRIGLPKNVVALFPFIKSTVLLIGYFVLVPRLDMKRFGVSLEAGFVILLISQALLFVVPVRGYVLLVISVLLEALALSVLQPLLDSLTILSMDERERARMLSVFNATLISVSAPFGWIAGQISEISRILPFVLNIVLLLIGMVFIIIRWRVAGNRAQADGC